MNVLYHHRTQGGRVESVHIYGIVDGLEALGHRVTLVGPSGAGGASASSGSGGGASIASRALRWAALRLPQTAFELMEIAYNALAYPRLLKAARASQTEVIYERAAAYCIA